MTIFSIYHQVSGESLAVTTFVSLSEETGIGMPKLKYYFTVLGKNFFCEKGVVIIRSKRLIKGQQRVRG